MHPPAAPPSSCEFLGNDVSFLLGVQPRIHTRAAAHGWVPARFVAVGCGPCYPKRSHAIKANRGMCEDTPSMCESGADCKGIALNSKRLKSLIRMARRTLKSCHEVYKERIADWSSPNISAFTAQLHLAEETVEAAERVAHECHCAVKMGKTPSGSPFLSNDVKPLEIRIEAVLYNTIVELKALQTSLPRRRRRTQ